MKEFWSLSDDTILYRQSIDSYLFIRFFRMICGICIDGTIITWTSVLWVNFRGGGGQTGIYRFAISNVENPSHYYFHAVFLLIYFGKF